VLDDLKFNPLLFKLVTILHYTYQIKYVCSHFYPSQLDTRMHDFPRQKFGMAHMHQEHANKYLPDIIEVNKLLNKDNGWLENRILAFN